MQSNFLEIHQSDLMHDPQSTDEYFRVGKNALDICQYILNGFEPKTIIDFPSGYGRVLRWFKLQWPKSKLYAVETEVAALEFCKIFGAEPVHAEPDLSFSLPAGSDLIFSGSLLTHFDEWQWDRFFKLCTESLSPEGILIFTTHGRVNALLARDSHPMYGNLVDLKSLHDEYRSQGFAFRPYDAKYPTFGLSMSSPSWILGKLQQIPEIKIVFFKEFGWGQDVYAIKRSEWPMV